MNGSLREFQGLLVVHILVKNNAHGSTEAHSRTHTDKGRQSQATNDNGAIKGNMK